MLINSFERDARNDGWKAGLQQGMQQGVLQTAAALKKMGIPIITIVQSTGLSVEEVEKL